MWNLVAQQEPPLLTSDRMAHNAAALPVHYVRVAANHEMLQQWNHPSVVLGIRDHAVALWWSHLCITVVAQDRVLILDQLLPSVHRPT